MCGQIEETKLMGDYEKSSGYNHGRNDGKAGRDPKHTVEDALGSINRDKLTGTREQGYVEGYEEGKKER